MYAKEDAQKDVAEQNIKYMFVDPLMAKKKVDTFGFNVLTFRTEHVTCTIVCA